MRYISKTSRSFTSRTKLKVNVPREKRREELNSLFHRQHRRRRFRRRGCCYKYIESIRRLQCNGKENEDEVQEVDITGDDAIV